MVVATGRQPRALGAAGATRVGPVWPESWSEAWASVLPPFVVSRALLLAVTLIVAAAGHHVPLQVWDQWDSKWYLGVAEHGYHWSLDGKPAVAFFPLYPLLVRMGLSVGLPGLSFALLLSNVAFGASLFYLYAIFRHSSGPDRAGRALWLMALFPTAFFTFAPYTEGLFQLGAAATLFYTQRRQALPTGLWLAVSVMTHSTGIILIPPIILAYRHDLRRCLGTLLPTAASLLIFSLYLGQIHIPLPAVPLAQRDWHRALTFPWTGFTASIQWLAQQGAAHPWWSLENLIQAGVTLIFLVVTILAWRELDPLAGAYCAAFWLITLTSPEWLNGYYAPFSSMDRLVLALFPLSGWVVDRLPLPHYRGLVAGFALLMMGTTAVHLSGGWVG